MCRAYGSLRTHTYAVEWTKVHPYKTDTSRWLWHKINYFKKFRRNGLFYKAGF